MREAYDSSRKEGLRAFCPDYSLRLLVIQFVLHSRHSSIDVRLSLLDEGNWTKTLLPRMMEQDCTCKVFVFIIVAKYRMWAVVQKDEVDWCTCLVY